MNVASVGGAVLLLVVGVVFLVAGALAWRRRDAAQDSGRRTLGIAVDLLVGAVAIADGATSLAEAPAGTPYWAAGSAVLVVAVVLLVRRHRRPRTGSSERPADLHPV